MPRLDEYLQITEAAEYLGVSPNTLRNWGRNGKFMACKGYPECKYTRPLEEPESA